MADELFSALRSPEEEKRNDSLHKGIFLQGKWISNLMVKLSHYKADNFMKSNLILAAASLSIKFVKSKSKSKQSGGSVMG